MATYTVFSSTGRALRTILTPNTDCKPIMIEDDGTLVTGAFDSSYMLVEGKPEKKSKSSITINKDKATASTETITLSKIPNPTTICITGNDSLFKRIVTDGYYEFSIDIPGVYNVECQSNIELPITFKVKIL